MFSEGFLVGVTNPLAHNADFKTLRKTASENNVGKEENAGNQYFIVIFSSPKKFQFLSHVDFV